MSEHLLGEYSNVLVLGFFTFFFFSFFCVLFLFTQSISVSSYVPLLSLPPFPNKKKKIPSIFSK